MQSKSSCCTIQATARGQIDTSSACFVAREAVKENERIRAPCYNLGQKGKEIPDRKLLAYRIDREPLPPCVVSVRVSPFGEG